MPILKGNEYPSDVVKHQQEVLAMKGYHLIYDEPCQVKDWEKPLPCTVTDGLCVDVFLYQVKQDSFRFRFSLNQWNRRPYVEIGDDRNQNGYYVYQLSDGVMASPLRPDLVPSKGSYYWIRFYVKAPNKFRGYYCNISLGEQEVDYAKLDTFFVHRPDINASNIISIHITKALTTSAPSPLQGNIPATSLNFTYATSTIHAYGAYNGGRDRKLQFLVYEYGSSSNPTILEIDVGPSNPSVIMFRIMSFGIQAIAGDGVLTASTTAMAGTTAVIVTIVKNFHVESVRIHTGMINW